MTYDDLNAVDAIELFDNYTDYLNDVVGNLKDEVYDMEDFDEHFEGYAPSEMLCVLEMAHGYSIEQNFECNADFFAFDHNDDLVTLYNVGEVIQFMKDCIRKHPKGEKGFLDWYSKRNS